MSRRVWTTSRKIWGNVAPLLVAIPFAAGGIWRSAELQNPFHWSALAWDAGAILAAWVAVGFLGLTGNRKMRMSLFRRFATESEPKQNGKWFVGIATPTYRSVWDPHEDVGFLSWPSTMLHFAGDSKQIELPREAIRKVGRARNVHSWLGMGGWVVVEGQIDGKPIKLFIEPREKSTLWGNRRLLVELESELERWRRSGG